MSSEDTPNQSNALVYCFVAVVLAVSLVGFLRGVDVSKAEMESHITVPDGPDTQPDGEIPTARSYSEMRNYPPGQGSGWEHSLKTASSKPPREGKVTSQDLERALAERAKSRAYDGAPPTIPHPVQQNSAAECMACHGQDLRFGEARAQSLPHDELTSCTQCHVAEEAPMEGGAKLPRDPRAVANGFVGAQPAARGPRAWNIAPPQIPHSTAMRQNCLSCHGESGEAPMQSSHTSRKSCTQCHAPSAELDQRPTLDSGLE